MSGVPISKGIGMGLAAAATAATVGAVVVMERRKLTAKEREALHKEFDDLKKKKQDICVEKKFKRKECIGYGAFGEVYIWKIDKLIAREDSYLAAKEFAIASIKNSSALLEESEKLAKLQHENIVEFYSSFLDTSLHKIFLFMELLATSIGSVVKNAPITEDDARALTRNILDGLIYIHGENIIHCDIKGVNVLMDDTGTAKLADIGICKYWSSTSAAAMKNFAGTIPYMSPEVLKGKSHGKRSDLWAVACTVLEMMNQHPPFSNESHFDVMSFTASMKQREVVQEMTESKVKDFLLSIFVEHDARPYPKVIREHEWLKEGQPTEISRELLDRINRK